MGLLVVGDLTVSELPPLLLPRTPRPKEGDWGFNEAMLGCLEGEWVFVLDLLPLRSPAAPGGGLLSLSSDTFINLGLGVLNIVRFSLQRALLNNLSTTHIMMNIKHIPANTHSIAGSV